MLVNRKSSNITVDLVYPVVPELNHWWTIQGTKITVPEFVVQTGIVSDYVTLSVVFNMDEEELIDITAIKVKAHDILPDVIETEGESGTLMTNIITALHKLRDHMREDSNTLDYCDYYYV